MGGKKKKKKKKLEGNFFKISIKMAVKHSYATLIDTLYLNIPLKGVSTPQSLGLAIFKIISDHVPIYICMRT